MRLLKALAAALALASAPIFVAAAFAQSGSVVVIDAQQLISRSSAGRDMTQKLQGIGQQMDGELNPERQALQTEQQSLAQATRGQTPDQINRNSQLKQRVEAFNRRADTFRTRQGTLARDMEYTRGLALQEFNRHVKSALDEVLRERRAAVALEASVVSNFTDNVNATNDLIGRLDRATRTINVTRQSAPQQQQQQSR